MSATGLAQAVAALRYKPGWEFQLTQGPSMSYGCADLLLAHSLRGTTGTYGATAAVIPDGLPLYVHAALRTPDSRDPEHVIPVTHTFPVPPRAGQIPGFDWERWLFEDVIMAVERHEAGEFFAVDGFRPFFPEHGPDANPYLLQKRERPAWEPAPSTAR